MKRRPHTGPQSKPERRKREPAEGGNPQICLTPKERALLAASREISSRELSALTARGGAKLDAEWQERVLRAAAELGHRGLEYLLGAVMAERGVNAWWTAERRKRLHGVPLEERPTTEEMLRDLLPAVHPFHFGTPKTDSDEDLRPLAQKTFFALRDPGVLDNLEILAQRRAIGVSDALEGIALALDPRLKLPRGRGRTPPSFDRRAFDQFSLLSYRLAWADAKARRPGNRARGELSLDEEAALKWLAKERERTGDPRPVEESDQLDATNAVAALKRRVKARQAEFRKRATFMKSKG